MLVLNAFVFPQVMKTKSDGSRLRTFLRYLDEGKIKTVEVQDEENRIAFLAKDENGEEKVYTTAKMDDPNLVDRIYNKDPKIQFSRVLAQENSPLLNFLLTWILPSLLFLSAGRMVDAQHAKNACPGRIMP